MYRSTPLPVAPPPPVAPLRSATTPTGPEAARQVREIIDGTQKMLDGVSSLGTDDRKANFQSAKALLVQAEEALKKEELTLARSFADRAQQHRQAAAHGPVAVAQLLHRVKNRAIRRSLRLSADCPYLAPVSKKEHNMWWIGP